MRRRFGFSNMPTHELRHEHFHEDARLNWAVASGQLPLGAGYVLPAFPLIYDLFLETFDRWNDSGANCP
jgi:hypothetical protein